MSSKGFCTLVGAGPGDPGLLTLAGRKALEEAEVVVYDRLVSQEILRMIPASALKFDVGKTSGHHPVPQQEIQKILTEQTGSGKKVVRLKGGDPYVFGRGGEEVLALREAGLDFKVIPGIPSPVGASAYAGIPVTHRDLAPSFTVITAHRKAGMDPDIPFRALTELKGTLVFLMGLSNLGLIAGGLLEAGMDPATPAAVISQGTTPLQQQVIADLAHLEAETLKAGVVSPALIVVGEVCRLSDSLDWFTGRPLFGKRFLVTGPEGTHTETFIRELQENGAQVDWEPLIETRPTGFLTWKADQLQTLEDASWITFSSRNGVTYFMDSLEQAGLDVRALGSVKIAAVGPSTGEALKDYHLKPDLIPEVYQGEALGQLLVEKTAGRVLVVEAEKASRGITAALEAAGRKWTSWPVYRTEAHEVPAALKEMIEKGSYDGIVCTSGSAAKQLQKIRSSIAVAAIGPKTAAALMDWQGEVLISEKADLTGLKDLILAHWGKEA